MASRSIARTERRLNLRAWFRIGWLVATLLLLIIPHLLARLLLRRSPVPQVFLRWAGRAVGLLVRCEGPALSHNVLFVANHLSWLDIFALGGMGRSRFVAKAEIASWGIVAWLADQNRTLYVARDQRRSVASQSQSLREALSEAQPIAIFPEGTTGDGQGLLSFRASLFAAVAPPPGDVGIQPVAIDYGELATQIAWTDAESTLDNVCRLLGRPGVIPVTIRFLAPLPEGATRDRKQIAAAARAAIGDALNRDEKPLRHPAQPV